MNIDDGRAAGLCAALAVLILVPGSALGWTSLQEGNPGDASKGGLQGKALVQAGPNEIEVSGDAIQKGKGALRKSVPISPGMKVPPHFNTPPKASKVEDPTGK